MTKKHTRGEERRRKAAPFALKTRACVPKHVRLARGGRLPWCALLNHTFTRKCG